MKSIKTGNTLNVAVIGGGFFGMYIAEFLANKGHKVNLYEKGNSCMSRASYNNQARIHNGYHYPRSLLTAQRSRISFSKFNDEFKETVEDSYKSYYLIGRMLSKVTAKQFENFCKRIDAPCEIASGKIRELINYKFIEEVYLTKECAFNTVKLKQIMDERTHRAGVDTFVNCHVKMIKQNSKSILLEILNNETDSSERVSFDHVFNCTYSMTNDILTKDMEKIPLKHELAEICLIKAPKELYDMAITIMCGPYFSIMPFPAKNGLHSFSHVRYTPHYEWYENNSNEYINPQIQLNNSVHRSNYNKMFHDAIRYVPILKDSTYIESLYEIKTILPNSEFDDSRPILFMLNQNGINGFHSILGGKIDNVYDIIHAIERSNIL